jgi:hypothetical protein
VERLVERAMTYAVEEYDDDRAAARLAWLAHDDQAALDQPCDVCLSHTDIDLGIRGRAIGLLARGAVPRPASLTAARRQRAPLSVGQSFRARNGPLRRLAPSLRSALTLHVIGWSPACRSASSCSAASAWRSSQARPRLLVHPGDLLTSRQPLAHDRDDLAVGGRLLG